MADTSVGELLAIQASMLASGQSCFSESSLESLRCVIRLTVEFSRYLQGEDLAPPIDDELRYQCDSIFSGVDSFLDISYAYRLLHGARPAIVPTHAPSISTLKEEFDFKYRQFASESDFEERCRLLLDLFKLQIVFAALSY